MQPILKYPGAKWNLAEWIIGYMPKHEIYLEPFFGSGAVFFNKLPSRLETINDIDGDVVNLFKIIRERYEELEFLIKFTPWARDEYYMSYEKTGDELEDARRFLVRCWQAFGTKISGRTGWRHSTTKNGPNMPKQWNKVSDRIMLVAERLKDAQIENMTAVKLIKKYNRPEVLIYLDPPYILSTRRGKMYKYEMDNKEHENLLSAVKEHKGAVMISGYDNDLYNDILKNWKKEYKNAVTEMGGSKKEVLWLNDTAVNNSLNMRLF